MRKAFSYQQRAISFQKRTHIILTVLLSSCLPVFLSQKAHAATLQYLQDTDVATIKSLETLFTNLVSTVASIAGVALFVMLLVGGFKFLFSGGDQKQLEAAKGTITHAVIGLVIIVAGFLIMQTIQLFTGVNVSVFTIPTN